MFLSYCSVAVAAASIGVSNYNSKTADLSIMDQVAERILIDEGVQCLDFNQYYVKDLKGNVFLVKLGDNGFAIIDVKTSIPIEVQPDMECPYSFSIESKGNNYYFGFGNYFFKNGEKFRNLSTGRNIFQEYMVDYQNDFDYELKQKRKEVDLEDLNYDWVMSYEEGQESKLVHNYEILKYSNYITNNNDCGFVAAASLLDFYDKTRCSDVVDDKYYDENDSLIDDSDSSALNPENNLKDKLIFFKPNKKGDNYGIDLQFAISQYLCQQNLNTFTDQMVLLSLDKSYFKTLIDCNFPFIGGGRVRDPDNPDQIYDHSFIVYGYKEIGNQLYYLANWGWRYDDKIQVYVPETHICSAVYLVLTNKTQTLTLDPNDFEVTNNYCDSIQTMFLETSARSKNGNPVYISSESFRFGVFENDFDKNVFSLSCKGNNVTTSFFSISFSRPVSQFKIELSKWDYNELVDETNGYALIKYKNLYYPDYDNIGVFLLDIANECDYEMKQWNVGFNIFEECILDGMDSTITISIQFPKYTRQIEFLTQYNGITNYNSFDKGRICIHKLEAKVYA